MYKLYSKYTTTIHYKWLIGFVVQHNNFVVLIDLLINILCKLYKMVHELGILWDYST